MTQEQADQTKFEGWAIVEVFGHQRFAGFVTTQVFGTAAMFRVDVPELSERDEVTQSSDYIDGKRVPAGSKIRRGAVQGYTKLFGVGAIYSLTPCSEAAARKAVEQIQPRPLMVLELPEVTALPAPEPAPFDWDDDPDEDDNESRCREHEEDFDDEDEADVSVPL